ncbi:carbohydrate ABC transporter permease [Leadbettera azotonutricia]|uniref:ABC transporter, permease protein n=1 Tax=Leadbettera azotonutricia (strain ATCC BAA-888 / DSM 13862 / ZAS-9) TaxID=545695 RepID=F5YEC5_LEAAZ|nr:carbohydrate ABC transporter permease [Leadbettera azotonutricia]AEF81526.1 ABC transporter, permease protein [Leadbettera azotonutricia ZAS-9]
MTFRRRMLHSAGVFFRFLALACFLAFAVLPLFWIFVTSLKPTQEIFTFPLRYFPSRISLAGYEKLLGFAKFGTYFLNSLWISLLASIGGLIASVLAGFSLSRLRFSRGIRGLLLVLYFTQMVPTFILMAPLFFTLSKLHFTNNRMVLAIVYAATTVAFGAIMAKSFFDHIPASLEEAALIDGCDPKTALFRVILPVSLPGLVAIFSFSFVNVWNELFLAVMFMSSDKKMTVPVALNSFISKAGISWDIMSAGIVMALIPTMVIFAIGQKYIVAGLTEGGVKG